MKTSNPPTCYSQFLRDSSRSMVDKYKSRGDRGFFDVADDDDFDDDTFLNSPRYGSSGSSYDNRSDGAGGERGSSRTRQEQLMDQIERIQQRTLQSSERAVGLVHESEQVGIATAENLMQQREQLENAESRVSDINRSLRVSQKHINSIKSIFSGFRGMFSKTTDTTATTTTTTTTMTTPSATSGNEATKSATSTALGRLVEDTKSQPGYKPAEHPALKMRGVDYSDEGFSSPANAAESGRSSNNTRQMFQKAEEKLDENLDDLNLGLTRLKGLALGLGEEIDDQNELLDRLATGVDKADLGIQRQNKQMNKILKK